MTIAIEITNRDTRAEAKVTVRSLDKQADGFMKIVQRIVLAAGESTTVYVHSTRQLTVDECEPEATKVRVSDEWLQRKIAEHPDLEDPQAGPELK